MADGELRAPAQHRGRVGRDPDAGGAGTGHRSPSFPEAVAQSASSRTQSRPRVPPQEARPARRRFARLGHRPSRSSKALADGPAPTRGFEARRRLTWCSCGRSTTEVIRLVPHVPPPAGLATPWHGCGVGECPGEGEAGRVRRAPDRGRAVHLRRGDRGRTDPPTAERPLQAAARPVRAHAAVGRRRHPLGWHAAHRRNGRRWRAPHHPRRYARKRSDAGSRSTHSRPAMPAACSLISSRGTCTRSSTSRAERPVMARGFHRVEREWSSRKEVL